MRILPAVFAVVLSPLLAAEEISWSSEYHFSALPSELDPHWKKLGDGSSNVSGDSVQIVSTVDGGAAWILDGEREGDRWDANQPTTLEFKVRIEKVDGDARAGAHIVLKDDDRVYEFELSKSELTLYRIVLEGSKATLYEINSSAEPVISSGKALQRDVHPDSVLHPNSILFGDSGRAVGGVSQWELIRWTNKGAHHPKQ